MTKQLLLVIHVLMGAAIVEGLPGRGVFRLVEDRPEDATECNPDVLRNKVTSLKEMTQALEIQRKVYHEEAKRLRPERILEPCVMTPFLVLRPRRLNDDQPFVSIHRCISTGVVTVRVRTACLVTTDVDVLSNSSASFLKGLGLSQILRLLSRGELAPQYPTASPVTISPPPAAVAVATQQTSLWDDDSDLPPSRRRRVTQQPDAKNTNSNASRVESLLQRLKGVTSQIE